MGDTFCYTYIYVKLFVLAPQTRLYICCIVYSYYYYYCYADKQKLQVCISPNA